MNTKLKTILSISAVLWTLVFVPSSQAALTTVGPVDAANGFPAFYQDSTGLSIAPCFDNNGFCSNTMVAAPGFDPALPLAIPANFPVEGFYFFATGGNFADKKMLYEAALEFSFANGVVPKAGDQVTFARIRVKNVNFITPGATVTVTHPYGIDTLTVDPKRGLLFFTEDIGLAAGIFTGALGGRVGPFLRTAAGLVKSPGGNVYIGDSVTAAPVTGGPNGNIVTVRGALTDTATTFILEGKVIGMSVTPSAIAFPPQRPAPFSTATATVTVTNLNSASSLTIASILSQGANAADFVIDPASPCLTPPTSIIAPAGNCTFSVIFSGVAAGPVARTAGALVSATLGTIPTITVPITGIIDAIPPSILSTFPTTTSAPANINVTLTFSESMDPATINATTFTLLSNNAAIPGLGAPVYNDANKTASLALPVAQENALVGTVITAQTTTGMTDLVGNPLTTAVTFSFTATVPDRTPPTIALFDPPDNSTGVVTDEPVTVTFSEPMLSTSITASVFQVTSGGIPVDGTVTVTGDVATFTPARPLAFGTAYTVTITTGAQDLASNALVAGKVINFITNFAPLAPEIVAPANGGTGVARPVILRWKPSTDQDGDTIVYHLFLCNNQAFIGTLPNCMQDVKITPTAATAQVKGIYYASVVSGSMLFTLFGLGWAFGFKGRKRILMIAAVLVISSLLIVSCGKKSSEETTVLTAVSTDLTFAVEGLSPNVTYYWKLEAEDGKEGVAATPVMTFTTQ